MKAQNIFVTQLKYLIISIVFYVLWHTQKVFVHCNCQFNSIEQVVFWVVYTDSEQAVVIFDFSALPY